MTESFDWLSRYQKTHEKMHNPTVYWAALPMIVIGFVGLLWFLPTPQAFSDISPLLNWGSAFLMATAIYYFIISLSLAIGLLPFLLGIAGIQLWLLNSSYPPHAVSMGLLLSGIVGFGLGRRWQLGGMLLDLQLIMIGPAWLLSRLYRRLGIPV